MSNIVLIGFRGTGKTVIGKAVAKKLKRGFVDSDDLVVEMAGKSIPKIFGEDGEKKFREIEAKVIEKISKKDNLVIATGGGVPCSAKNVENLKKNGIVFLLEASAGIIFSRIQSDSNRPSLTGKKNKFGEVLHLLKERKPFYENAADFRIKTEGFSVRENAVQIIGIFNKEAEV